MSDTKNLPKTTKPNKSWSEQIAEFRAKHRHEISAIAVMLVVGFISALCIYKIGTGIDRLAGLFLIIITVFYIFYRDIKRYKPLYLKDHKMMVLLGLLVVFTLLLAKLFSYLHFGLHRGLNLPEGMYYIYGIPIPLGAMLVSLLFDFHTAMIFSVTIGLITGIWFDNPYYTLYVFIGSLTASFSVVRCKKRSAIIKAGFYVSLVNILLVSIIHIAKGSFFDLSILPALLFVGVSGVLISAIVSVVLPLIEMTFDITTDISLLELLDLDQPLMRQLMITAPGTYHHSVIAGSLAEAAAEAVGANALLARVSAYYHDIGKIKMPEYFVENQTSSINKHDKLTASMSSMILISHVKEGVELARQHKIPRVVCDIIQQHHGTSLIAFFYKKAIETAGEQLPSEEAFRYPGPKPQTRVAALVMMADAVEAASRTLDDPTPARISALVDRIINNIFLDGQIDECELTLKDLSIIKSRFTYILTSIFHRRVQYPVIETKKAEQRNGNSNKEPAKS